MPVLLFPYKVAEKELKAMFMKIDTNCDETVSWSEYLTFILCELQKKDLMRSTKNDNPLPDEISHIVYTRHHNFINRYFIECTLCLCRSVNSIAWFSLNFLVIATNRSCLLARRQPPFGLLRGL